MGQDLGLASVSEARASACVSMYSRIFVTLPFRTVMAKTQLSLNALFVALCVQLIKILLRDLCASGVSSGFCRRFCRGSEALSLGLLLSI